MNKLIYVLAMLMVVSLTGCGKKQEAKPADGAMTEEIIDFKEQTPESKGEGQTGTEAGQTAVAGQEAQVSDLISSYESLTVEQQQAALKAAGLYQGKIDGILGPQTKKSIEDFQMQNELVVDGKVDLKTWERLKAYADKAQGAGLVSSVVSSVQAGPYLAPTNTEIQQALQNAGLYQGAVDGNIGSKSKAAISAFQTQNGLTADGKVGPKTWAKLKNYLNPQPVVSSQSGATETVSQ